MSYLVTACSDHLNWHFIVPLDPKLINRSITNKWCEDNCEGKWTRDFYMQVTRAGQEAMYFEDEEDMVKFMLKF